MTNKTIHNPSFMTLNGKREGRLRDVHEDAGKCELNFNSGCDSLPVSAIYVHALFRKKQCHEKKKVNVWLGGVYL